MSPGSKRPDLPPSGATENFRRQHRELLEEAGDIGGMLTVTRLGSEAAEVRRRFARFAGKLSVHARMENEGLYPWLLEHDDATIRAAATELFREVEGIYEAFAGFLALWPSAEAIEAQPAEFVRQAARMFRLLGKRMLREEAELYPLVDGLR